MRERERVREREREHVSKWVSERASDERMNE